MIELSKETVRRVHLLFHEKDRELVAKQLTQECGDNLPMVESSHLELVERIRFAVLKLSGGDREKLHAEIKSAAIDWRDTLMSAGFGNDVKSHLSWEPHS